MSELLQLIQQLDNLLVEWLQSIQFTSNLVITPVSKIITEILFISFILLVSYETIYWSGIYLHLWDYHAKDIFKEVPIHCAHVYVRLNLVDKQDVERAKEYYKLKNNFKNYNILLNWNKLNQASHEIFKLQKFIKYHFEFSPEDFEMNDEPEYGSNIKHLRGKIIQLFNESDIYNNYKKQGYTEKDVLVFNNANEEVTTSDDLQYLSKVKIETGNIIDSIIVL